MLAQRLAGSLPRAAHEPLVGAPTAPAAAAARRRRCHSLCASSASPGTCRLLNRRQGSSARKATAESVWPCWTVSQDLRLFRGRSSPTAAWPSSSRFAGSKKQPALTRSLTEGDRRLCASRKQLRKPATQPTRCQQEAAQESDLSHAGSRPCSRDGTGGTLRGRCSVWGPQSVEVYARRPRVIGRAPSDV